MTVVICSDNRVRVQWPGAIILTVTVATLKMSLTNEEETRR